MQLLFVPCLRKSSDPMTCIFQWWLQVQCIMSRAYRELRQDGKISCTPASHGYLLEFTSWQHLRSYQYGYWLGTVHTYSSFIVLPTGRPDCQHYAPLSHSVTLFWIWTNQSLPYPNHFEHLARKRQVYIVMSLVWLDQGSNLWFQSPDLPKREMGTQLIRPSRLVRPVWFPRREMWQVMGSKAQSKSRPSKTNELIFVAT